MDKPWIVLISISASEFADAFYAKLNTVVNMFVSLKIFRSAKTNKKLSYPTTYS